ncbi:membrane hypothetical protein [uncultured Alphaproteobacteria bacterium]|uniref:DUF2975 domain-containing protein n=1 Tax=uncultured Alphaproteobacteria bacterium TaxID=91750 RepID=A0A212KH48_9PROT|nr:membrane hypothetical protein [uncultured Alphaproteobacteria bacterium]
MMTESFAMARVRRLSRRLSRVCVWSVPVLLCAPPLWWGAVDVPAVYSEMPFGIPYPEALAAAQRAAAAAVTLIPAAAMAWLLWLLHRLFAGFARGEVFCEASSDRLRRVARALAVVFAAGVVYRPAIVLALTLGNPPGQRGLSLGLSAGDCAALLLAAVAAMLAWAFAEAARLREENAEIV